MCFFFFFCFVIGIYVFLGHGCMSGTITAQGVSCSGYFGCESAAISASSTFSADGDFGANGATITNTPTITANGYFGLRNADISSQGLNTLTITSSGEYSLYNAVLNCMSGSSCDVTCDEGTTCKSFTFNCYDDAECTINCDSSCSDCPSITQLSSSGSSSSMMNKIKKHNKNNNKKQVKNLLIPSFGEDIKNDIVQLNNNNNKNNNLHKKYESFGFIGAKLNTTSISLILIQIAFVVILYEIVKNLVILLVCKLNCCGSKNNKSTTIKVSIDGNGERQPLKSADGLDATARDEKFVA